jgi:hypothetical protein
LKLYIYYTIPIDIISSTVSTTYHSGLNMFSMANLYPTEKEKEKETDEETMMPFLMDAGEKKIDSQQTVPKIYWVFDNSGSTAFLDCRDQWDDCANSVIEQIKSRFPTPQKIHTRFILWGSYATYTDCMLGDALREFRSRKCGEHGETYPETVIKYLAKYVPYMVFVTDGSIPSMKKLIDEIERTHISVGLLHLVVISKYTFENFNAIYPWARTVLRGIRITLIQNREPMTLFDANFEKTEAEFIDDSMITSPFTIPCVPPDDYTFLVLGLGTTTPQILDLNKFEEIVNDLCEKQYILTYKDMKNTIPPKVLEVITKHMQIRGKLLQQERLAQLVWKLGKLRACNDPNIDVQIIEYKTLAETLKASLLNILQEFRKYSDRRSQEYRTWLLNLRQIYEQLLSVENTLHELEQSMKNPYSEISLQPIKPSASVSVEVMMGGVYFDRKREIDDRVYRVNQLSHRGLFNNCDSLNKGVLIITPSTPSTPSMDDDLLRIFMNAQSVPSKITQVVMHLCDGHISPECLGFLPTSVVLPVLDSQCLYDNKINQAIQHFFHNDIAKIIINYIQPMLCDHTSPNNLAYIEPSHAVFNLTNTPLLKQFRQIRVYWRGQFGPLFRLAARDRMVPLTLLRILACMPYTELRYMLENMLIAILQEPYPKNQFPPIYNEVMSCMDGYEITNPDFFDTCITFASVFYPQKVLPMLLVHIKRGIKSFLKDNTASFNKKVEQNKVEIGFVKLVLSMFHAALSNSKRLLREHEHARKIDVTHSAIVTNPFGGTLGFRTECSMNNNGATDDAVTYPIYLTGEQYDALPSEEEKKTYRHISADERGALVANKTGFVMGCGAGSPYAYVGGTFKELEEKIKNEYDNLLWIRRYYPPTGPLPDLFRMTYQQKSEIDPKVLALFSTSELKQHIQNATDHLYEMGRSPRALNKELQTFISRRKAQRKENVRKSLNIYMLCDTVFPFLVKLYPWLQNFSTTVSRKVFMQFRTDVRGIVEATDAED